MSAHPSDPHHDTSRRRPTQLNRSLVLWIVGVSLGLLILVGGGYWLYSLGMRRGTAQSVSSPTPTARTQRTVQPTPVPTPATTWMLIGTVTSATNTSVTIKMANGESQTVRIDSKTTIQGADQSTIALKSINKDANVIASGVYLKDRTAVAQIIRLTP